MEFRWPHQQTEVIPYQTKYVYNLILDRHHILMVDGLPCVTMGHGLTI